MRYPQHVVPQVELDLRRALRAALDGLDNAHILGELHPWRSSEEKALAIEAVGRLMSALRTS